MNVLYDMGCDVRFVGPAEDLRKLKAELEERENRIQLYYTSYWRATEKDVYPVLRSKYLFLDLYHEVIKEYPRVEYCCTVPSKYGSVEYFYKKIGERKFITHLLHYTTN